MSSRVALALLLLASHLAVADPAPDAEQLYRDGQTAYDQARYDDALGAWQRSYDLSHAPPLLYNIAQAYRVRAHPGDCALARAQYQSFVELSAPSPQRALAEGYIAQLATCASAPAGAPAPSDGASRPVPSDDASTHERSIHNRQIAVAVVGAGGIVLLTTGIYLGHRASTLGNEVTSACAASCDWSVEKDKDAAGHRDATLGWTFDTLSAIAIVGSAALYYFGVRDTEIRVAPIATRSRESGAVLSWSKTW